MTLSELGSGGHGPGPFRLGGRRCAPGWRTSRYLADDGIAGVVYLADRLAKPVLVEGPAGTGKTQLAKSVAECTGSRLIRLQCYEGLDESKALYEWNYRKQLLRIQAGNLIDEGDADAAAHPDGPTWNELEEDIFSEDFLLTRPLLEAIRADEPVVLLIDEVDRVELETEALLLEILSEYQVSIPELGTVKATQAADGVPHLQQHPRALRGPQAALPLPAHRLPRHRTRARRSSAPGCPGITAELADQVARIVRSAAHHRAAQAAVGVRDPRLGPHARRARAPPRSTPRRRRDTLHILLKYQTDIERAAKELLTAPRLRPPRLHA